MKEIKIPAKCVNCDMENEYRPTYPGCCGVCYSNSQSLIEIDLKTGQYRELPEDFYQEVEDIKNEIIIDKDAGEL